MNGHKTSYLCALAILFTSPALMGIACEPVDLGGNPDAGPAAVTDAGPGPLTDAGALADAGSAADGAVADAGAGGTGAVVLRASEMVIDFIDGAQHQATFEISVHIDDPSDVPHDVRPRRFELLAGDGTAAVSYALDATPIPLGRPSASRPGQQIYRRFDALAPRAGAPASLVAACANDTFRGRLLYGGSRLVVEVDGVEHAIDQVIPRGSGGYPPLRPFVLCHDGVSITRNYTPFTGAFLQMTLRPDGLYDAYLWETPVASATTYTTSSRVATLDADVTIAPMASRFFPSAFPTFRVSMSHAPCPASGCTLTQALERRIIGQSTVPLEPPGAMGAYWCREPAVGTPGFAGPPGETWPPSAPSNNGWQCNPEGLSGDGMGVATITGTTDAGSLAIDLIVGTSGWYYRDSLVP